MAECVEEIFEAGEDTFNESDLSCEAYRRKDRLVMLALKTRT
jgi:hypothetical protein